MTEALTSNPAIEFLEWDSEFLGRGIGRIRLDGLSLDEIRDAEAAAKAAGIECLYADLDPTDPQPTYEVQTLGYRFVESSTLFILPLEHPRRTFDIEFEIRKAVPDDLAVLEEHTAMMAPWSRYAVDPHFGLDVAFRMQMASLERMVRCETDERQALVTLDDDEITCFVGMRRIPEPVADTVATFRKGGGAAGRLIEAARDWAGDEPLLGGTCASRNIPVFRYVQNCGFRVLKVEYKFHRWFDED
ncbi:MAG: hypothetical protein GX643_07040 [Acidimicrobiales bacterium]|nr:hypothetical protein [Acidimicrobiales bacterium]